MKQELLQKQKLPEGWKIISLGEIGNFLRSPFDSSVQKSICVAKAKYTYKLYEQGNVINNDFLRGTYYITKEKFQNLLPNRPKGRGMFKILLILCSTCNVMLFQLPFS